MVPSVTPFIPWFVWEQLMPGDLLNINYPREIVDRVSLRPEDLRLVERDP